MPRIRLRRLIVIVVFGTLAVYAIGIFSSLAYVIYNRKDFLFGRIQVNAQRNKYIEERQPPPDFREHIGSSDRFDRQRKTQFVNSTTTEIDADKWMSLMDEKMLVRKQLLTGICGNRYNRYRVKIKTLAEKPRQQLRALIVNDQNRFLYSIAYKVGSTNWERIIVEMAGYKNVPNQQLYKHNALKWTGKLTNKEVIERLHNYTKFIFVRNPFSRILSAYKDKFVDHHFPSFNSIGRTIIKKYRKSRFNVSEIDGTDVSFQEFVDYLTDGHYTANVHWTPIHIQNCPCEIDFDYIGKLEDANDDIKYVLMKIGIWGKAYYHKAFTDPASEKLRIKTYYSSLTRESIAQLYRIYEPDFLLFGYNLPEM
ncbi:carbohydrate sulfotransferase 11-like [Antedon mediterranea]|uniref:carbohydrate sulfotransferase 11-like n=1 Tax=Antedon mediterranea TaxID=105859 RepID=UPI003AF48DB6